MPASTTLATANVEQHLPRYAARAALEAVLEHGPDLVGLQEWYPTRWPVLTARGRVHLPGFPRLTVGRRGDHTFVAPLVGGCVVGARTERYTLVSCRQSLLSRPGRADRPGRHLGLEPPRLATVVTWHDRRRSRPVTVVVYHLVSGVQRDDVHRVDRPGLVRRHRAEVRALRLVVSRELATGADVHAMGDSNWHGFELPGLVSAWRGREEQPGTLGPRRHVDDVFSPVPAERVVLVDTPSDHRAVVVEVSSGA